MASPFWSDTFPPASAASLAVSSTAYLLGTDNSVNTFAGSWTPQSASPPTTFIQISAASDGTAIGVDVSGDVYLYVSGSWVLMTAATTAPSVSAAVSDANNYVVVDSTGAINRVSAGFPTPIASGPTQIATTSDPTVMWGVDASGTLFQWDESSGAWNSISGGSLVQVSVSDTGAVYGVDASGNGYSYNGSWSTVSSATTDPMTYLAYWSSTYWAVTSAGGVYQGF